MKLKTLLIVVVLLAAASAVVYFVQRPDAPAAADARVGQPLLAADVVEKASAVEITDAGQTVSLRRQADGTWQVTSFHDLPADFGKLSRFIRDLTDAKVERLVTSNPESLARLNFGATSIRLLSENGQPVWSIQLGRNADGGGRFVQFGDENKAYRARLTAWLDTTSKNWADSALLALKAEEVAKVEISFPEGSPTTVQLERGTAEEPFKAVGADGRTVRQATVTSLLSSVTGLRFTDTTTPDDAAVAAARAHQRQVVLTTFDGDRVAVALGRKPEEKVAKPAAGESPTAEGADSNSTKTDDGASVSEAATETISAGPVIAFIDGEPKRAKLAAAADRLAFKVSDYVFTSLPKTADDLFDPPAPAAGSNTEPAPSTEHAEPTPATEATEPNPAADAAEPAPAP